MRFLLLLTTPLLAQSLADARRAAHPEEFALIEAARAAPPEFAAWGILRVLDGGGIRDRAWQLELIDEALHFSAAARHALPKRVAASLPESNSRANTWSKAYSLGLDRLSLSMRAIEHLRRIDPALAHKRFQELPRPAAASPACADPFIDDPSPWYRALRQLKPTHEDVMLALTGIRSHSEIKAAASVVLARRGPVEELPVYANALAQALTTLPASARAFSSALGDVTKELGEIEFALRLHRESRAALAAGWKSWLTAGLEKTPCAENGASDRQAAVAAFTKATGVDLPDEIWKANPNGEPAEAHVYRESSSTKHFRRLLFGTGEHALSAGEKDTPEWRRDFQSFVQEIESHSQASDESAEDFFIRRSQVWTAVLMVAPPSDERARALSQYVAFALAHASHIDPVLWFAQVEAMVDTTRSHYGDAHAAVLDQLGQTGHPVLALYAGLERSRPTRPTVAEP
ncbi:MAG: hypothetical protein FJW30_23690 [Acidobacteria bacterium]|nr:hypothetical protein [Acidobacteriota bacterium]